MTSGITIRPAAEADIHKAFAVFRRSLLDYLFRLGMASEAEASDPPIEPAWERQKGWIRHLWDTAAENWLAVDPAGEVVGWALTIERGGHLELAFFFVDPRRQEKGLGRELLARALPQDHRHRTIVATQDARALALYLRAGLSVVTSSVDFNLQGAEVSCDTDLMFEPMDEASVATVLAIEEHLLGLRREADIRFLMSDRPGWIARRGGEAVGYAFGPPLALPGTDRISGAGPIATLEAADVPAMIDKVVGSVAPGEAFFFSVPLASHVAVAHLLARGARIDPFYFAILTTHPAMRLDRYIHTAPAFIL